MKLDQCDAVLKPLKSDWSASEAELIDPSVLMMRPHGFLSPKQLQSPTSLLVSTAADDGSLPAALLSVRPPGGPGGISGDLEIEIKIKHQLDASNWR